MYKENEAVVFDVEEDTKNSSGKTRWIGDLQHFSKQSRGYRDLNVIRVLGMTPPFRGGSHLQLGQCSDHSERVWKYKNYLTD